MAVIQELFKVPILRTVLNLNLNNIKLFCDRLKENQQGRQKSNKGGWQSFDFTSSVTICSSCMYFSVSFILKSTILIFLFFALQSIQTY